MVKSENNMRTVVKVGCCIILYPLFFQLSHFLFSTPVMGYNAITKQAIFSMPHPVVGIFLFVSSLATAALIIRKVWKKMG